MHSAETLVGMTFHPDMARIAPASSLRRRRGLAPAAFASLLLHGAAAALLLLASAPLPPDVAAKIIVVELAEPAVANIPAAPQAPTELSAATSPDPAERPPTVSPSDPVPPPPASTAGPAEINAPVTMPMPPSAPSSAPPRPAPPTRPRSTAALRAAPSRGVALVPPAEPAAAAPPAVGPTSQASAAALGDWRLQLAAWLRSHQVYPPAARSRGDEGSVGVHFSLDDAGHVLEVDLMNGSGVAALDEAALLLLRGATLPAPPPGTLQAQRSVSVQLRYRLER